MPKDDVVVSTEPSKAWAGLPEDGEPFIPEGEEDAAYALQFSDGLADELRELEQWEARSYGAMNRKVVR